LRLRVHGLRALDHGDVVRFGERDQRGLPARFARRLARQVAAARPTSGAQGAVDHPGGLPAPRSALATGRDRRPPSAARRRGQAARPSLALCDGVEPRYGLTPNVALDKWIAAGAGLLLLALCAGC